MITKELVTSHIEEFIAGTDMFIVDVTIRPGNNIEVTMDCDDTFTIEACTDVHRHLLKQMDRDVEDYGLTVSSPDLTKPLQVKRQYVKNIGRMVQVKKTDKAKLEGELLAVTDDALKLLIEVKEEVPGKKKKELVQKEIEIPFAEIDQTKIVIQFK
jgi:ribosome maturation factor RimP